jgi:hypothetical protein
MASELRTVADILLKSNLVRDPSPLLSAASKCTAPNPDRDQWEYECVGLLFVVNNEHMSKYRNTIPGNLMEIEIELNVRARGKCRDRTSCDDPFDILEVDCRIEAHAQGGPFVCAWHLDRNQGDADEASRHFAHPCYHFQFGGRRLPRDLGYGRFLFIESPRLAHPPLDAILAIDFILTNYFPNTWRDLHSDNQRYMRAVREAQHRCWGPYATTTASGWASGDPSWTAEAIWPQLIPIV